MTTLVTHLRPARQLPEPGRFWIAFATRTWRFAEGFWTDLANARLSWQRPGDKITTLPEIETDEVDGLFYLPAVRPSLREARNRLAASLAESGVEVLVQLAAAEPLPIEEEERIFRVHDLLEPLLSGELDRLGRTPSGATAVWPLIAGRTDLPEDWEEGCAILKAAGVRTVQGVAVEISPQVRRRLAEGQDEEIFDALFHGQTPSERHFSRIARANGLESFVRRPDTGRLPRQRRNRALAGKLALAGELWTRLERGHASGQAFFRAARGAEATHHDLVALAREGNLTVMDWLDARSLEIVAELVKTGRSELLSELLHDYLSE